MIKYVLFGLLLIAVGGATKCQAATYEILFEEGAYHFDSASSPNDVDNKYLARVSIKKDGKLVASNLRGSTLSDAWAFYRYWNVELGKTSPPVDNDVVQIFQHFRDQTNGFKQAGAMLGTTSLADFSAIADALNHVPVLPSGHYAFVTGPHKHGDSVHGKPYAARLLGLGADKPYDPDHPVEANVVGGFIRTLNPNNAQGQRYRADGINVHDGRTSGDYKDSEGCLTIRPDDWKAFYQALPDPKKWTEEGDTGTVTIVR